MKVSETFVYPFPIDAVYRMQTDRMCREESARESGAVEFEVSVTKRGTEEVVQVDRKMKADDRIPDFMRRFIGDFVHVRQTEHWAPAAAGAARVAHVRVHIKGQPATMDARLTLTTEGAGTRASLDGDLKVPIPIVGKKIEPEIARAILGALHIDQRIGLQWLEANA